jgi:hypothetical protein
VRFGVALYKTNSTCEVWCCTIQDYKVHLRFGVALYKTGEFRRGLVWQYTRLENKGEIWCRAEKDWKIQERFGVAL